MAEHALAVLVDFENMARPGAKSRGDFDIHLVLDRLAEKGRVLVKKAYADWSRYREAKHDLQNAGLELIEMPSAREGAKNRADIKLAVDAMELAYSREHVGSFVVVSGDSDFTPLVGKLRELNKRVIGVGNRESASNLLIANCDEFIFYDNLVSASGGGRSAGVRADPLNLLKQTLSALMRDGVEPPLASVVKDAMKRKDPAFDENDVGFSTYSKFLEDAAARGFIRLRTDERSGTYRVELADGQAVAAVDAPTPDGVAGLGDGRRRRRRRRGEGGAGPAAGPAGADALPPGAEVFELVITPTPDPDLGKLPAPGEPLSYEDMILMTPEVDEVPLMEVSDVPVEGPPPRSARRRRRRMSAEDEAEAAGIESDEEAAAPPGEAPAAESPVEVLAELVAAEAEAVQEVVAAAEEIVAEAEAVPAAEPEPEPQEPVRRRRVRRRGAGEETPAAEAPVIVVEAPGAAEAEAPAEAVAQEAPAKRPARKRTTRKKAEEPVAEAVVAEETPAEPAEEKPKRRRTTRTKAEEPVPAEV